MMGSAGKELTRTRILDNAAPAPPRTHSRPPKGSLREAPPSSAGGGERPHFVLAIPHVALTVLDGLRGGRS
jgi:hypothetical protein